MKKKRRVFDIDFEAETPPVPAGTSPEKDDNRRGPMAAAISENAGALVARSDAEAKIRAENDALAHEHVRLKKLGLITDLIPLDQIKIGKLKRDRVAASVEDVSDLVASISALGLSNPIVVEQVDDGYELIQGYRRWSAFKQIATKTGKPEFQNIPATLLPKGETIQALYRRMVDENMIRQDVSFGEMALLAIEYGKDMEIDPTDAVGILYESTSHQKRAYIRNFVQLLDEHDLPLAHPQALPRSVGVALCKMCNDSPGDAGRLYGLLVLQSPDRTAVQEVKFLRDFLAERATEIPKKPTQKKMLSKTTLRFNRPGGEVRCLASDGQLQVKFKRDFGAIDRDRLERAMQAFFETLGD
ncbi:MAG: ParB/RepB/Spo0J family partition protein [Planktomarina sp.]